MTYKKADQDLQLKQIYDRYSSVIYHLLLHTTSTRSQADQLLITIFTDAREELPSFLQTGFTELGWLLCFTRSALKTAGCDASPLYSLQGIRALNTTLISGSTDITATENASMNSFR